MGVHKGPQALCEALDIYPLATAQSSWSKHHPKVLPLNIIALSLRFPPRLLRGAVSLAAVVLGSLFCPVLTKSNTKKPPFKMRNIKGWGYS